jgi:hypothetical protein
MTCAAITLDRFANPDAARRHRMIQVQVGPHTAIEPIQMSSDEPRRDHCQPLTCALAWPKSGTPAWAPLLRTGPAFRLHTPLQPSQPAWVGHWPACNPGPGRSAKRATWRELSRFDGALQQTEGELREVAQASHHGHCDSGGVAKLVLLERRPGHRRLRSMPQQLACCGR